MELGIVLLGLGALYVANKEDNHNGNGKEEAFSSNRSKKKSSLLACPTGTCELPNTDIPNKNYPSEFPIDNIDYDQSSALTTNNLYDTPISYQDKFFNTKQNTNAVNSYAPMNGSSRKGDAVQYSKQYKSLTGEKVDTDYFKHDNMTPYFGGQVRGRNVNANASESLMDHYLGNGSQDVIKKTQAPLFTPKNNMEWAYGQPSASEFIQDRMKNNIGLTRQGEKLFQPENVSPMTHLESDREKWMPKNVDELRIANKPKAGGLRLMGHEGPAMSHIKNLGIHGIVEKNRPETSFPVGPDRWMTTTGIEKKQSMPAEQIERFVNRSTTNASYMGGAGSTLPDRNSDNATNSEYGVPKRLEFEGVALGVANANQRHYANEQEYEIRANQTYHNNRSHTEDSYFGIVGGAIGAVISPLLDVLKPSRKENAVGNLRPYENAGTTVSNSYIYNPYDKPAPTLRDTLRQPNADEFTQMTGTDRHGAYGVTGFNVRNNERQTTTADYSGVASAGVNKHPIFEADYAQPLNDMKASTIHNRHNEGGMRIFGGTNSETTSYNEKDKMVQIQQERTANNTRGPAMSPYVGGMGEHTNMKNSLYGGIEGDRNTPDILDAFRQNPYTKSLQSVF